MLLCAAGAALAAETSGSSEGAVTSSGAGTSGDPYKVSANVGDEFSSRNFSANITVENGSLPTGITIKNDGNEKKISGKFTKSENVNLTVKAGDVTVHYEFSIYKPVKDEITGTICSGYGTQSAPWKFSTGEGREINLNLTSYGNPTSANLPAGLTLENGKISGAMPQNSQGEYSITLKSGDSTYYLVLKITNTFPAWTPILILIGCAAVLAVMSVKWGNRSKD